MKAKLFRYRKMTNEDRAYQTIKQLIISGKYQPGHLLSENQMSIKLKMSRTPIREAIKKLELEGLIQRDGQKTFVTQVDLNELKENYDLRSMLESYALKQNFTQLDRKQLDDYKEKFEQLLIMQDWNEYLTVDREFHTFLIKRNNDDTLQKCLDLLQSQTNRMRFAIRDDKHCIESSVKEILAIIAAIEDGDQDKAVTALENHIKEVYQWEASYLQQQK